MQPACQDLCCACCQVPLVLQASCFEPLLPPLCQQCYPSHVLNLRLLREAFLDPYVPSGQPVHRFLDYRLQACPNPCASLRFKDFKGPNPNLHSPVQPPSQETRFREKPTLATGTSQEAIFREKRTLATCLSQEEIFQDKPTLAAALFCFMLPHAAELPHSENPSSAAPSLNALEGCPLTSWAAPSEVPEVSAATPEYGCKVRAPTSRAAPSAVGFAPDEVTVCTGCGVGPTLASLTDPVARHFVQVCHRAQRFRAKDELTEVLQVCHNFCATCVYQWSRLCMDAHIHAAGRRGKPLSGSLYFPVGVFESDSCEEADHVTSGTIGPVRQILGCRGPP